MTFSGLDQNRIGLLSNLLGEFQGRRHRAGRREYPWMRRDPDEAAEDELGHLVTFLTVDPRLQTAPAGQMVLGIFAVGVDEDVAIGQNHVRLHGLRQCSRVVEIYAGAHARALDRRELDRLPAARVRPSLQKLAQRLFPITAVSVRPVSAARRLPRASRSSSSLTVVRMHQSVFT